MKGSQEITPYKFGSLEELIPVDDTLKTYIPHGKSKDPVKEIFTSCGYWQVRRLLITVK